MLPCAGGVPRGVPPCVGMRCPVSLPAIKLAPQKPVFPAKPTMTATQPVDSCQLSFAQLLTSFLRKQQKRWVSQIYLPRRRPGFKAHAIFLTRKALTSYNVHNKRVEQTSEWNTFLYNIPLLHSTLIFLIA